MRVLLTIIVLFSAAGVARPQRCGDSLLLYLRNDKGKALAPSDFESVWVSATYTVDNVSNLVNAEPKLKEMHDGIKSFSVRAECGMKVAEFQLKYKGDEMTIRVLNVPGDAQHILLDGIKFRKGTYEVDLGGRPMKNVEDYSGPESKMEDPADEIKWAIKDRSLRKTG